MSLWKKKKIAVLGYGFEGKAMVQFALAEDAEVTVCDANPKVKDNTLPVTWQLGETYLENLTKYDVLVRSPGIPFFTEEIQAALQAGVAVTSQTKEFFARCQANIVGVTGTKGKGTTATLIYRMLEANGRNVHLVGNIGTSAINLLPSLRSTDVVVYELSSFQLQDLDHSPHVAVVLGISTDHQDHHQSLDEYHRAKQNIVRYQSADNSAIINIDYPVSASFTKETLAQVFVVSTRKEVDKGIFIKSGNVVVRMGDTEEIILRTAIALPGAFNLENVCAAVAVAHHLGVSFTVIGQVLTAFTGLSHRFEYVAEIDGVTYWNNSYGTTPETAIAAIASFSKPIVLLLGGFEKGFLYEALGEAIIVSTVKKIVGIGENIDAMYAAVESAAKKRGKKAPGLVSGGDTMLDMVQTARALAAPGDAVLLSPAAASFDKFKNVKDRGEQFTKAVIGMNNTNRK